MEKDENSSGHGVMLQYYRHMNATLIPAQQLALKFGAWSPRTGKLTYSKRVIAVDSLLDASKKWDALRDAKGYSSSACPVVMVVDVDSGEDVAKISYNGRVWAPNGIEIQVDPNVKTVAQHEAEDWADFKIERAA
jgi:hypothetical protein